MITYYVKHNGLYFVGLSTPRRWVTNRRNGTSCTSRASAFKLARMVRDLLPMGLGHLARVISFDPRRIK